MHSSANVGPSLSRADQRDMGPIDSKSPRKFSGGSATLADDPNVILRELGARARFATDNALGMEMESVALATRGDFAHPRRMSFSPGETLRAQPRSVSVPNRLSLLVAHIGDVVRLRTKKQVGRITAELHIAAMQHAGPMEARTEWDRAVRQFPRETVRRLAVPRSDVESAVAGAMSPPQPALLWTAHLDLRPEPFCYSGRSHRITSQVTAWSGAGARLLPAASLALFGA